MLAIAFVLLAVCLVFGSAFVLLRTAQKPRVPKILNPWSMKTMIQVGGDFFV